MKEAAKNGDSEGLPPQSSPPPPKQQKVNLLSATATILKSGLGTGILLMP